MARGAADGVGALQVVVAGVQRAKIIVGFLASHRMRGSEQTGEVRALQRVWSQKVDEPVPESLVSSRTSIAETSDRSEEDSTCVSPICSKPQSDHPGVFGISRHDDGAAYPVASLAR